MYGCGKDCLILIPFRLPHISCFTVSVKCFLKCFPFDSDDSPDMGSGPLFQFPHLPWAGPVLLTLLIFPLIPLSYRVLCASIYSFPLVRHSCSLSAGVLHALLCLKVCSWCIHGERCTPHPPTPTPSRSSQTLDFVRYFDLGYFRDHKTWFVILTLTFCHFQKIQKSLPSL